MNEELKLKIIAAAYKDCSLKDRMSVWLLTRKQPECKALFDEYRKTAISVHSINIEECPGDIVKDTFRRLNDSPGFNISGMIVSRPALVTVLSVVLLSAVYLAVITTWSPDRRTAQHITNHEYTKQEVAQAQKDVKESLAIVSRILNKTSRQIGEDILPRNVGKPIKQGIEVINQLFPKGVKNDENS
jgi:hypothetical protein